MNATRGRPGCPPRVAMPTWPALIADLPAGLATRPPTTRDVRTGACAIIAAVGVLAAVLLSNPDNGLAFVAFVFAAATLIVAPVITAGLIFDVRHQKRSGGPCAVESTMRPRDR